MYLYRLQIILKLYIEEIYNSITLIMNHKKFLDILIIKNNLLLKGIL